MNNTTMNLHRIESLMQDGESDTIEFKKSTAELNSAGKTLCALLNRRGGYVLIGITNDKRMVGQDISDQTRLEIAHVIRKIEPSPPIDIDYIAIADTSRHIIAFTVRHDKSGVPFTLEGRAYERLQSSTSPMLQEKYHRLLLEKTQKNKGWEDGIIEEVTLDDLDHEEILRTIREGISNGRIPSTQSTIDRSIHAMHWFVCN